MDLTAGPRGHVVVCGTHGLAYRVIEQLVATGEQVVAVDPSTTAEVAAQLDDWGVRLVGTHPRRRTALIEAGIRDAAAVICADDDDVVNLEVALAAREIDARTRLVVHLRNAAVGRALTGVVAPGVVLDVAALAGTAFVEAVTWRDSHPLDLGGTRFVTATVVAARAGTIRGTWGDLAPVAVRPADGGPTQVCPGRDVPISAGDRVTLLGTPDQLAAVGVPTPILRASDDRRRRPLRDGLAALRAVLDRPLRVALFALGALAVVSVALLLIGYHKPGAAHMSPLDAVYFTVETITTVGFGDFTFTGQPDWLRLWAVLLMIGGAAMVALVTALLVNTLITRRLDHAFGLRRITRLRGHVVVVGLGPLGAMVAAELRAERRAVVVVEQDEHNRYLEQVRAAGVPVLLADATVPQTLEAVSIGDAAGVAILSADDLLNLEIGLAVRDLLGDASTTPVVLRVFGHQLARAVGRALPVGIVRSPAELAAPWFVGAALGLEVIGTFYVGSVPLLAGRFAVTHGCAIDGVAMLDMPSHTRVVAISRAARDGRLEHPPRRDTRFEAGDEAYVVGTYEALLALLKRSQQPMA
jgi:Trk K+ transport system NAD-binding subunit